MITSEFQSTACVPPPPSTSLVLSAWTNRARGLFRASGAGVYANRGVSSAEMFSLTPWIRRGLVVPVTPGLPAAVALRATFWLVPPCEGPIPIQRGLRFQVSGVG